MNYLAPIFSRLMLMIVFANLLVGKTDHQDAFAGTWKLNVTKSKFASGRGPRSETVTANSGGKTTLEGIEADGKPYKWSYPWSDGKEVPIDGFANATMTETIAGSTLDQVIRLGGKVVSKNHGVLSKSGRTVTFIVVGTDEQGHSYRSPFVYEN